jgi:hypothetical protein
MMPGTHFLAQFQSTMIVHRQRPVSQKDAGKNA